MRLVLVLLLAFPAFAADDFVPITAEERAMTDVPWAPGSPAVILDWSVRHNDDESHATESMRIKVLREEGKSYADVELYSIPRVHTIRDIRARTTSADGTVSVFDGQVYEKTIIKGGGMKLMKKTFTLPNVRAGTIIDYRYKIDWPSSQLRTRRWMLQREIPIVRASFWIKPYRRGIGSICVTKGLPADKTPGRVKDHFEFMIERVAPFAAEPMSPPEVELKPRIEFYYAQGNAANYWAELGGAYTRLIETFIGNRAAVRKIAEEVVAGAESEEEKLRRLYARVQQLRNLSFERDRGAQKQREPGNAEEVLQFGYGSRGDLNRLFIALARAAGFEAEVLLVSSRDDYFLSRAIPDGDQFSGEIAVVKIGGADRFLDPGTPHNRFGLLPWEITASPALRLRPKLGGTWIMTPDQPYGNAVTTRTADVALDGETLKGTATITWRGQEALQRRLASLNEDESENRTRIESEVKAMFAAGSTVKLTKLMHLEGTDEPLVASFDIELPNHASVTSSRVFVPMSLFTSGVKNPFAAEKRTYAVYFRHQHQIEDRVTLRLPEGFTVESVPQAAALDAGACRYSARVRQEASAVTFERKLTMTTFVVSAGDYPILRKFAGNMQVADNDPVVMRRNAGS